MSMSVSAARALKSPWALAEDGKLYLELADSAGDTDEFQSATT